MAILNIDGQAINSSHIDMHYGNTPPHIAQNALDSVIQFEKTKGESELVDLIYAVENCDALFAAVVPFGLGRTAGNRLIPLLMKNYPLFSEDWSGLERQFERNRLDPRIHKPVWRILLALQLCTSARNLKDVTEDVWAGFISTLKDENSQWKSDLNIGHADRRAFSELANYLNANFPTKVGYDKPIKVRRLANEKTSYLKPSGCLKNPSSDFAPWVDILNSYQSVALHKSGRYANEAGRLLASWLEEYPMEIRRDPKRFLSEPRTSPSIVEWVKLKRGGDVGITLANAISYLARMVDWYIDEEMTVVEGDEVTRLGTQLLPTSQMKAFENEKSSIYKKTSNQATSANLPLKWIRKLQNVLTHNDWEWPKSLENHHFVTNLNGREARVWNPVCAYLIYAMTEIPWRKIQFKQLDSGEGDDERYNYQSDEWVPNDSEHSGYWQRQISAKRTMRGVLNKNDRGFCFYVNTNKTSDRDHRFGEGSGYTVPWKYVPLIKLFSDLRDWQEKYNPAPGPAAFKDVVMSIHTPRDTPTEEVMDLIPDRFYLFRDAQGLTNKSGPPTDHRLLSFWRLLLDEVEKQLRAEGEDAVLIASRNSSGNPLSSYFSPHGLRVAGLTAFAEAGVPIQVLSKLVAGHASILMTIYYLKHTTAHVTDILTEARVKLEAIAAGEFSRHLQNIGIANAARIAVANEDYTLERVGSGEISTDLFFDTGLGVCPFAGTRCDDGLLISKGRTGPVPGGPKNCLHCRHFISGEPWLNPLVLNQQRLSAKAQSLAQKYNNQIEELGRLETERAQIRRANGKNAIPLPLKRRISQLEEEIERHALVLDSVLNTMHKGHILIERIKRLQKLPNTECLPTLVAGADIEIDGYREGTRFELIDSVLQSSRIYPILRDDDLEMERERFIDAVMYNNGLTPLSMMSLSAEQKRRAADAASEWLLRKVGAQEADLLAQGAQTLKELGFDPAEIGFKMDIAAGRALTNGSGE